MNIAKTLTLGGGAVVVLAAAIGLAAPWYSSQRMESELHALVAESTQGDFVLRNLNHQAGWMSSTGSLDVVLRSACARESGAEPVAVRVDYAAKHWLTPQGLGQFSWSAAPAGSAGEAAARVLGKDAKLTGDGMVTYAGLIKTSMVLPEIQVSGEGETLQVTPSTGSLVAGGGRLQFDWTVDQVVMRGQGNAVEAKQLSVAVNLKNRMLGTGTVALRAESISTGAFMLEGLSLSSDMRELGDRLNAQVTQSVRTAQFMGQTLKNMTVESTFNGLHSTSVLTISKAFSETCGFQSMTLSESQQVRDAVRTLLNKGMTFGISKLHGSGNQGSLDGQLLVTLSPAQGDTISLARQLSSNGRIAVEGEMVTPEQKEMALSTGFVQPTAGGLQSSYEYGGGLLKVSGKTLDTGTFKILLAKADEYINAYLSGKPFPGAEQEEEVINPPEALAPAAGAPQATPKG